MVRSAARKVMWVGRATVFLVGLAVVLALLFGVATTAMGVSGHPFLLGKKNVETAVSTLVKRGKGPALKLQVGRGAPLAVNSSKKVSNLNADKVDGRDASEIGVNGLERVAATSPDNSSSPKQQSVDCPTGKVLVGSGYDLSGGKSGTDPNATSDLVVDFVEPTTNADGQTTGVVVGAYEIAPISSTWNFTVYGICANAP